MSRYFNGWSDAPERQNALLADARARTERFAAGGQTWHDPRSLGQLPDLYIAMGQTAETSPS